MGKVGLFVELLSHTPDPENIVSMGAKLCYTSSGIKDLKCKIWGNDQAKFIRKLKSVGHESPFEHVAFTFGIEGVSRSLLAQITRHRIASFSVQSQRYVDETYVNDTFDFVIPESIELLGVESVTVFKEQMAKMQEFYDFWRDKGVVPEDARFVLPNAASTKMVVTMNARELMHFFRLRCCRRAQWEIRALAGKMLDLVLDVAPVLFEKSGPSCWSGICPEGAMSCLTEYNDKPSLSEVLGY